MTSGRRRSRAMTRTLILQSFPDLGVPCWVERCRASVRSWAQQQNYAYEFMGDELFAKLPDVLSTQGGR